MVGVSDRVWAFWREASAQAEEPAVFLLFRSELGTDAAISQLRAAASKAVKEQLAAARAAGDEDWAPGHWALAPTSEGVVMRIDEEPCDLETLVLGITDELERRGVEGIFDLYEPAEPADLPVAIDLLECRLRVAGRRVPNAAGRARWEPGRRALEDGAVAGITWCSANGTQLPLSMFSGLTPTEVDRADVEGPFLKAVELAVDSPGRVVTLTSIASDRFRTLSVSPRSGRISLIEGGVALASGGWRETLDSLRAELSAASAWAVYGFVKRGSYRPAAEHATSLAQDWPPTPHFDPNDLSTEAFEDEFAPDAFGSQLLGPAHNSRLPKGGMWSATSALTGATLLDHRDAAAWFAQSFVRFGGYPNSLDKQSLPVPELLIQARRDFARILIKRAVVRRLVPEADGCD